jgi:hypothetical protein
MLQQGNGETPATKKRDGTNSTKSLLELCADVLRNRTFESECLSPTARRLMAAVETAPAAAPLSSCAKPGDANRPISQNGCE